MGDRDRTNQSRTDGPTNGSTDEANQQRADQPTSLPGNSGHKGDDHLSDAGWGSESSGGSVIDKRKPESR